MTSAANTVRRFWSLPDRRKNVAWVTVTNTGRRVAYPWSAWIFRRRGRTVAATGVTKSAACRAALAQLERGK